MKLHVEVTEDDIRQGERGVCSYCPIALAVKRCAATDDVTVPWPYCSVGDYEAWLPPVARRFIADFDRGVSAVEPIAFDLELEAL